MSDKKVVRVAIAGFGFMGRMHYGIWKKLAGVEVVAFCDKNPNAFKAPVQGGNIEGADVTTDFGDVPIFTDYTAMLAEARPDVVSLTLPTPLHVPLTLEALAKGVSVLCEKPMALTTADCDLMVAAAKAAPNGAQLMVGHCLRFWPAYVFLKELVDSKQYGEVVAANFKRYSAPPGWQTGDNWFMDESKSGGVALDLHIHDTDMVHFLFGMPKSVVSTAAYDATGAMLHLSTNYEVGNAAVTAEGSWAMTPTLGFEASYMVTFEKAVVIMDGKRTPALCVYPLEGEPSVPDLPAGDGYEYEIKWFLDLLQGRDVPMTITPQQSRDSVRIIDAEKKSALSGEKVILN